MHHEQQTRRLVIACGVVMLLLLVARPSEGGLLPQDSLVNMISVEARPPLSGESVDHYLHRLSTHADHAVTRLGDALVIAGTVFTSTLVFLLVAAVSSAVDLRMLRRRPSALWRYLGHGTLTFFRILLDRGTPNRARLVLLGALLYWLVSSDLIPDNTMIPGLIDDVLIAVIGAKTFIYLCPDRLIAGHAAVEVRG
jgi:uncharacterized membrane protein YkvA (DUF1232 family)